MRTTIAGAILALCFANSAIPAPTVSWKKFYGGSAADGGKSVIATSDGGFAACGYTYSVGKGMSDAYLVKTDSKGKKLWERTYGGPGSDCGNAVIQSADKGFLIAGYTCIAGHGKDVYLVKTDPNGNMLWEKTFGGSSTDSANGIIAVTGSGYLICGFTESAGAGENDVYLIRVDATGKCLWSKTYGGPLSEWGQSIVGTQDGKLIIAGSTGSFGVGQRDIYVLKVDSKGQLIWQKTYGGGPKDHEWGSGIARTADGGFIVTGYFDLINNDLYDAGLIKIDQTGKLMWSRRYGEGTFYDFGRAAVESKGGGIILVGETKNTQTARNDVYLLKLDKSGTLLWKQKWGGAGSESVGGLCKAKDGSIIITGQTESFGAGAFDLLLMKLLDK